jgi:hypothetical protein
MSKHFLIKITPFFTLLFSCKLTLLIKKSNRSKLLRSRSAIFSNHFTPPPKPPLLPAPPKAFSCIQPLPPFFAPHCFQAETRPPIMAQKIPLEIVA